MQNKSDRSQVSGCCDGNWTAFQPEFFKALSEPNRIALLIRLAQRSAGCTVGELACCCPVDLSVVSRHLGMLREAGLVRSWREGKTVRYRVDCGRLVETLRAIADALEACCGLEKDEESHEQER
ncbi:MAG: helix-turn-helix transcriptional regulator [Armatimonadetes bacterium]|nr:helix-turn-helix transcriptional regulator [Armatimonadota bacterium]